MQFKKIIVIIIALCLIMGSIFLYKAYDKYTNYYNSEKYTSFNVNAYVGGDAYNYIINGNYFTGFSVLGMGFYAISAILSIPILLASSDSAKEEAEERKVEFSTENVVA